MNSFLKNTGLLLFAFFIACIFWLGIISSSQNIKAYAKKIPVKQFNIASTLYVSTVIPSISLKIDTVQTQNEEIPPENFEAFIDFTGIEPGIHSLPIQVKSNDTKIRIVSFEPRNALINIEETEDKIFPVSIETIGHISPNYQITSKESDVKTVIVHSGTSILSSIRSIKAIVPLNNDQTDIHKKVTLEAFNSNHQKVSNVSIDPESIDVNITLSELSENRSIGVKVPFTGSLPENIFIKSIKFSPNIVQAQGKKQVLDTLQNINTKAIDVSTLSQSGSYESTLDIPNGIKILGSTHVKIDIEIEPLIKN